MSVDLKNSATGGDALRRFKQILESPYISSNSFCLFFFFFKWRSGCVNTRMDVAIMKVFLASLRFPPRAINQFFLTLISCIHNFLGIHGNNDYSFQYAGKHHALLYAWNLPTKVGACASTNNLQNISGTSSLVPQCP